jgi:hypothetical protein
MKTPLKTITTAAFVAGAFGLVTPLATWADTPAWNAGQAELEKNLPPGQAIDTYRPKLEKLGYRVTALNYNDDDYVEYEVVKGNETWEVQIDVDDETRKAESIEIDPNVWKTEATERALAGNTDITVAEPSANSARYSDRRRAQSEELIKELEALPVGHTKEFYRDALKKHGYEVTKVSEDSKDLLKLEAVKNKQSVELNVSFDEADGKSTKLDADSLWVESESTYQSRTSSKR